jgi:hypothetical protein
MKKVLAYTILLTISLSIQRILSNSGVPWGFVFPSTLTLGILAYMIIRYEPKEIEVINDNDD